MNVRLATQVLSESVFKALQTFGPPGATATAWYIVICLIEFLTVCI